MRKSWTPHDFQLNRWMRAALVATLLIIVGFQLIKGYIQAHQTEQQYKQSQYLSMFNTPTSSLYANVPAGSKRTIAALKRIDQMVAVYRNRNGQKTFPDATDIIRDISRDPSSAAAYGFDNHSLQSMKSIFSIFTSPDSRFSDDVSARAHPDTSFIFMFPKQRLNGALPGSPKPPNTKDILAYTSIYAHTSLRHFPGDRVKSRPSGFYLVLWNDGVIQKIPYNRVLFAPLPDGDIVTAFPGEAGIPANAMTYAAFYALHHNIALAKSKKQ